MITVKLTCDLCGVVFGDNYASVYKDKVRDVAEKFGWKNVQHEGEQKDMCPACVKAWTGGIYKVKV